MLRQAGATLMHHLELPDHHAYRHADLRQAWSLARQHRVDAVVTTQKDYVKWAPLLAQTHTAGRPPAPVLRPVLALRWLAGESAWSALLAERLGPGLARAS
jgi:hypothetical protein